MLVACAAGLLAGFVPLAPPALAGSPPSGAPSSGAFLEGVDDATPAELPLMDAVAPAPALTLRLYTGCWYHQMPVERSASTWGFNDIASQLETWNNDQVPMVVSLSYDPPVTTEPPNPSDEAAPNPEWPVLYARCAADFARRFGSLPYLRAIDVTNEPDIPNESTSDGAMPFVQLAVVDGVEAAHQALRAGSRVKVGFSWAYATGPFDVALFSFFRAYGGTTFDRDVGFVDMHIYPGTFAPEDPPLGVYPCSFLQAPGGRSRAVLPRSVCLRMEHVPPAALLPSSPYSYYYSSYATVVYGVDYLRGTLMPLAGLAGSVPILIGETGYRSSGAGTSPSPQIPFFDPGNDYDQLEHLYGEWTAAWDLRSQPTNVGGFIWYELADHYLPPTSSATSYGSCSLPQPYSGVLTNCVTGFGLYAEHTAGDYTARPVMCAYKSIVADPEAADLHPTAAIGTFDTRCPYSFTLAGEPPFNA